MNSEHPALVLWFTGLSGSGKSTLCKAIAQIFEERKLPIEHIDGDVIREVFQNGNFDKKSRLEHLKWVGLLASYLEKHGVIVLASFISPYQESRDFVRSKCKNFIEVYLSTPLEKCEERDVKGLYKKARSGLIKNFTGIDSEFEPPHFPEITIDTSTVSIEQAIETLLAKIDSYLSKNQRR